MKKSYIVIVALFVSFVSFFSSCEAPYGTEDLVDIYAVSITSNNSKYGKVTGVDQKRYPSGSVLRVKAEANTGYYFVRWSDNKKDNPRTISITKDVTLQAMFEKTPTYTVTVKSANTTMGKVSGGGVYKEGETATIKAIPNSGYQFANWSNGTSTPTYSFRVTKDVSFTAYFKTATYYTITVKTADAAMGNVSGGGQYQEGTTATIKATPKAGYKFSYWSDGSAANPRNITVSKDVTLTAYFTKISTEPTAETVSFRQTGADYSSSQSFEMNGNYYYYEFYIELVVRFSNTAYATVIGFVFDDDESWSYRDLFDGSDTNYFTTASNNNYVSTSVKAYAVDLDGNYVYGRSLSLTLSYPFYSSVAPKEQKDVVIPFREVKSKAPQTTIYEEDGYTYMRVRF